MEFTLFLKGQFFQPSICMNCSRLLRVSSQFTTIPRSSRHHKPRPPTPRQLHTSSHQTNKADFKQIYPLKGYYSDILNFPPRLYNNPLPYETATSPKTPDPEPSSADKLSIVFGTRLAGPGYSSTRYNPTTSPPDSTWHSVNGVPIPPRPEEPDNCCMSGCVHCVWDDYRDDVEAWAARVIEAKKREPASSVAKAGKKAPVRQKEDMRVQPRKEVQSASLSMDDDGGGSETSWAGDMSADADELFAGIPVGIREFMKTEKKLKEQRRRRTIAEKA
ncbi:hypothetical protein FQN57_006600 [Myotisia sp. PD_48]|nr:hypothetical protein FQN57_006600 [Myotisia sp. PD_48]